MSDQLSAIELNRVERHIRCGEVAKSARVSLDTATARRLYDMAQEHTTGDAVQRAERLARENERYRDWMADRGFSL